MKRIFAVALALLSLLPAAWAGGKHKAKKEPAAAAAGNNEVHWMTLEQAQEAMKRQPRKVWIDVYTDWCGWCKVMDKKTFTNPSVIQYMNEHFYAVRLNAEQKEPIRFNGKTYAFTGQGRNGANELAVELLQGQLTYPSSIFMQENFKDPMPPMAGYLDVPTIEVILTYLGKEKYKVMSFDKYQAEYTPGWGSAAADR